MSQVYSISISANKPYHVVPGYIEYTLDETSAPSDSNPPAAPFQNVRPIPPALDVLSFPSFHFRLCCNNQPQPTIHPSARTIGPIECAPSRYGESGRHDSCAGGVCAGLGGMVGWWVSLARFFLPLLLCAVGYGKEEYRRRVSHIGGLREGENHWSRDLWGILSFLRICNGYGLRTSGLTLGLYVQIHGRLEDPGRRSCKRRRCWYRSWREGNGQAAEVRREAYRPDPTERDQSNVEGKAATRVRGISRANMSAPKSSSVPMGWCTRVNRRQPRAVAQPKPWGEIWRRPAWCGTLKRRLHETYIVSKFSDCRASAESPNSCICRDYQLRILRV